MSALDAIKIADDKLAILDSFHDFCTKERKKASAKGEDDDDEVVSESRLEVMRAYIGNLINYKRGLGTSDIKAIIPTLTEKQVTSLTNFENNVVNYYETQKSKEINVKPGRETLTFETIVKGWDVIKKEESPLWSLYRINTDEVTILEINKGTKSISTYNDTQRNIIANFILNYFFGTAQGDMRCTFDAKAGVVSKIFDKVEQVKNVIFPQTIADSATTTFGTMRGRNEFLFPTTEPFPFVSNLYTKDTYKMQFRNRGFEQRSPYAFSIDITDVNKNSVELPFSSTQTEGPSVNYLIDLTDAAEKNLSMKDISKKKNILSLGKYLEQSPAFVETLRKGIQEKKNGLFLDIKRGGDHEAAAVTQYIRLSGRYLNFIFVTIDLLCALESRRRGNPTIWHYGERMILYRFPIKLTQAQEQAILKDKIKEAIRNFTILTTIGTTINQQLQELKKEVTLGTTAFVKKEANTHYNQSIVYLLQLLLQERMKFLLEKINAVEANLKAIENKDNTQEIEQLNTILAMKSIPAGTPIVISGLQIPIESIQEVSKILLNQAIEKINKTLHLDISIDVTFTAAQIQKNIQVYTKLLDEKGGVYSFKQSQNVPFNYDTLPFDSLYISLAKIGKSTEEAITGKKTGQRVYQNFMKKEIQQVKKDIQDIMDQYLDDTLTEEERDARKTALLKTDLLTKMPFLNTENPVYGIDYNDFVGFYESIKGLTKWEGQKGGTKRSIIQKGGDPDPRQYFDLSDLLLEISSMAAAFIESTYSELFSIQTLATDLSEVGDIRDYMVENYDIYKKKTGSQAEQLEAIAYLEKRQLFFTIYQNVFSKFIFLFETKKEKLGETKKEKDEAEIYFPATFVKIQTLLAEAEVNINTIEKFNKNLNLIVTYFTSLASYFKGFDTTPSIESFFAAILSNPELVSAAEDVKDEMQRVWESGLNDSMMSDTYKFEDGTTAKFITRILSLQADGTTQSILTPVMDFSSEEFIKMIPYSGNLTIPILLLFTMLENIQNPNKYSFFLQTGYQNKYFDYRTGWETDLYNGITSLITIIHENLKTKDKLNITKVKAGGTHRYPKKTRRYKKKQQSRRKRRATKKIIR